MVLQVPSRGTRRDRVSAQYKLGLPRRREHGFDMRQGRRPLPDCTVPRSRVVGNCNCAQSRPCNSDHRPLQNTASASGRRNSTFDGLQKSRCKYYSQPVDLLPVCIATNYSLMRITSRPNMSAISDSESGNSLSSVLKRRKNSCCASPCANPVGARHARNRPEPLERAMRATVPSRWSALLERPVGARHARDVLPGRAVAPMRRSNAVGAPLACHVHHLQ